MKTMVRWLVVVGVAALLIGLALPMYAEQPDQSASNPPEATVNQQVEVRPDIGPATPGMIPGENGYKVFNPGAIVTAPVKLDTTSKSNNASDGQTTTQTVYRSAHSDAWLGENNQTGYIAAGDHDSESDLYESAIWVDGALKRTGGAYATTCMNHGSGAVVTCSTRLSRGVTEHSFTAHGWHHFSSPGWQDTNLQTEDHT